MSKKSSLISFLFGESQGEAPSARLLDAELEHLFETAAKEEELVAKRTPLAKALKKLGLDVELELDPEGFSTSFEIGSDYQSALAILSQPDNMHTLATLGWVFARRGDVAMDGDVPEFRIRFMDVAQVETSSGDKAESLAKILKQAQKFATTPAATDEELDLPAATTDGVGEAKDGGAADSTIREGIRALCRRDHGDFRMGDLYHVEHREGACHVFQHHLGSELSESLTADEFDQYFTVVTLSGAELTERLLESGGDIIHSARAKRRHRLGVCSKCQQEKPVRLPDSVCDSCGSRPATTKAKKKAKK